MLSGTYIVHTYLSPLDKFLTLKQCFAGTPTTLLEDLRTEYACLTNHKSLLNYQTIIYYIHYTLLN